MPTERDQPISMSERPERGESSGGAEVPADTIERETPRRDVGLVLRPNRRRMQSYTPAKQEDLEDDESDLEELAIDLSTVDRGLLKNPHTKMTILKQTNHYAWSQFHSHLLWGRGLLGFVTGSIPKPAGGIERRNWMIYDQWVAQHLRGCVEETQHAYINSKRSSKAIWEELKRVHGISGKERLAFIL